jgi:hypothetical protein
MRWGLCVIGLVSALGCGSGEAVEISGVVRDGRSGEALGGAAVRASGGGQATADEAGRFTVRITSGSERVVRAVAPGRCPGETELDVETSGNDDVTVNLFPRLELEESYLGVGFGQDVVIEARTRCDDDENLRWTQISGPPLDGDALVVSDGGRRVVLKTPRLEDVVDLEPRISVVSLSRAQRADFRLRMETTLAGRREERTVRVTAASPHAGTYQVATGVDTYFNGGEGESHRWSLLSKPEDSQAELVDAGTRTPHLRPDRFGQYMIRHDTSGLEINVQAGAYDDVPRDCGRTGCHQPEDEGWKTTIHARTFQRALEGELGAGFDDRCWACHATGVDPGVHNGGFHETAASMGWSTPEPHPGAWEEAPPRIRRMASVWCSACHGPGRILPPQFHWEYQAKFSSGVCAQCHDAVDDPDAAVTSWHFREWSAAAMATFVGGGDEPGPAARRGCARCHSAQGFVAFLDTEQETAPEDTTVYAITCSTCHDPHDGSRPHALRIHDELEVSGKAARNLGTGAICAACHQAGAPDEDSPSAAPHAPQTDVLLGRGSLLLRAPRTGPHAQLANSCVACHMAEPDEALRGRAGGHTFSVRDLGSSSRILAGPTCSACHGAQVPPQAIGEIRDWDGDGVSDNIGREFERALRRVKEELATRIAQARVRDECGGERLGENYVEYDAQLLLVDAAGNLLGDCDGDGSFGEGEEAVGVGQLSRELRKIVWDVAMLEKDGSRGRHNPAFTFDILTAVRRKLR